MGGGGVDPSAFWHTIIEFFLVTTRPKPSWGPL